MAQKKPSKQITWSFCSRQILYSRWRLICQRNLPASVLEHLPMRSRGSGHRLPQPSGTVAHRSSIQSPAPLRRSSLDKFKGEHCDHWGGGVLYEGEDLTSGGVVGELSFPFEGRFYRQGTRLCNVHNLKATLTIRHLDQQTGTLVVNKWIYSELGPVPDWGNIRFRNQRICSRRISPSTTGEKTWFAVRVRSKVQQRTGKSKDQRIAQRWDQEFLGTRRI